MINNFISQTFRASIASSKPVTDVLFTQIHFACIAKLDYVLGKKRNKKYCSLGLFGPNYLSLESELSLLTLRKSQASLRIPVRFRVELGLSCGGVHGSQAWLEIRTRPYL